MSIRYNSGEDWFKHPFGAVKCNTEVTFRIVAEGNPFAVFFVADGNKIQMKESEYDSFVCRYRAPDKGCLVHYHFEICYDDTVILGKGEGFCASEGSDKEFQLTVYEEKRIPGWVKSSVCYQIFPDRFCRIGDTPFKKGAFVYENWNDLPEYRKNNDGSISQWDFFGGNFKGIESKLQYLHELGINLIYLNPIFSARSNHRYDTSDYLNVDSTLGTNEDFASLVRKAKSLGIRIILDGVFNHTGCDSLYFDINDTHGEGAYHNEKSEYRSWYTFFEDGSYECWWGVGDLPAVNETEPSYKDFIITGKNSVIRNWFSCGIDGWRLDVADELPDEFLKLFRSECRKVNPESYVVGEVWEDASNKVSYDKLREYFTADELDGVMNYPFREGVIAFEKGEISAKQLAQRLLELSENYPLDNMLSCLTVLGTHDSERILTALSERFDALKRAVALQIVYPGIPCVYYGDEAGVLGGKDPDNRRTYPWGHENAELMSWYKKMIDIRKRYSILSGGRAWFGNIGDDVFYIKRFDEKDMFYVFVNRGEAEASTDWGEQLFDIETKEKINGSIKIEPRGIRLLSNKV